MGTALQTMRTAIWAPNGQPAYPSDGWTARQATWSGLRPVEPARILLCHGADASAAPSFLHGVTAFEAFCHNLDAPGENLEFCHGLLDAGATVNRPAGKPSWALHGVVRKGWRKVFGCLSRGTMPFSITCGATSSARMTKRLGNQGTHPLSWQPPTGT
jgi:hypothetical protein